MNTTQSESETTYEAETAADAKSRFGSGLPDLRELRRPVGDRMIAGVAQASRAISASTSTSSGSPSSCSRS